MRNFYSPVSALLFILLLANSSNAQQPYTNRGTDFWVGYQRTNGFSMTNSQEMVIYMAAGAQQATVNIQIVGTGGIPWIRQYIIPANTAVQSDFIPKIGVNNATLQTAGFHDNQGIHITSDVPIVAYAHIYESTNSGATMLLPTNVWGHQYYTVNNRQNYSPAGGVPSATVFHVIAKEDSTWVEINPSKNTTNGWGPNGGPQPNGAYLVKLNKGDVFQVLGGVLAGSEGLDLSGSSVKAIPNGQGVTHPVAVFSGSTRTGIGCGSTTGSASGDLIIQQVFPYELWGTKYLTAPFSNSVSLSSAMTCIYRVMVKDMTTVVTRNGSVLPSSSLVAGSYYQFESNTADRITSDKPIMVAQYMSSNNACPNTSGHGDPEMIFLTPTTGAIPQANFYRNLKQDIQATRVTVVIPSAGMSSLKIDNVLFSNIPAADKFSYDHPNMPGYVVATKRFPVGAGQSKVESNYAFTGYTYGIGPVESYGYNLGIQVDSPNLQSIRYNTIKGITFLDRNKNGVKDPNEPPYPLVKMVTMRPGVDTFNTYAFTGDFAMFVDSGTYITSAKPFSPYYTAVPVSDTSQFPAWFATDSMSFAIQLTTLIRDLAITVVPLTPARPGFNSHYKIIYVNKGTDTANATISLAKSNKLNFISSSEVPSSVTADTIKWNLPSLMPGTVGSINITLKLSTPPTLNNGDTLVFNSIIASEKTDSLPADNSFLLAQRVTGSYDPNDKTESHNGQVLKSALTNGERLHYTIRFQNTGSDTAFNVVIRDTLSTKLDWNSLIMTGASHSYQLVVNDGRCAWSFNNINLVDSGKNEPLSHGFISFSIQPLATVIPGDVITNRASIYFDHNLPVLTNSTSTAVTQEPLPVSLLFFNATKKPEYNLLQWKIADQVNFSHFEIERSENGHDFSLIGKISGGVSNDYSYTDHSFAKKVNYYRLKLVDKDNKFRYSLTRRINNGVGIDATLYPNPARDVLNLRIESIVSKKLEIQLLTADGRLLQTQPVNASAGVTITPLSIASLSPGLYLVKIGAQGEAPVVMKFEKK